MAKSMVMLIFTNKLCLTLLNLSHLRPYTPFWRCISRLRGIIVTEQEQGPPPSVFGLLWFTNVLRNVGSKLFIHANAC